MKPKTKFKVIIAGGRDFQDYDMLKKSCDYLLRDKTDIEIVSGGARGADKLGERYAQEKKIPFVVFEADWDKYGKSAGIKRNESMAAYADALIAFWDGKSRGTQHMIGAAYRGKLKVRTRKYE